ncbi:MAG: hypothetical protein FWG98_13730 [Candidatus Cloacimonetes bacterium]|nr:hypothetical protein [Candidatus Cloacimonadota bacterium]
MLFERVDWDCGNEIASSVIARTLLAFLTKHSCFIMGSLVLEIASGGVSSERPRNNDPFVIARFLLAILTKQSCFLMGGMVFEIASGGDSGLPAP